MDFQVIKEELAANVKKIDPISKKLKFELDDDVVNLFSLIVSTAQKAAFPSKILVQLRLFLH